MSEFYGVVCELYVKKELLFKKEKKSLKIIHSDNLIRIPCSGKFHTP